MPTADLGCLRQLFDFWDFGLAKETVIMLKPVYVLKGAPRAWRKKLHQVLVQWLSCRQFYSEPELYCVHRQNGVNKQNTHERAQQHNEEQQVTGNVRNIQRQAYISGDLRAR